ncbi:hypothetical protein SSX86_026622 [Deinandra increscens subsp. villosa]|uniref:RING-type domain-containing protein n=1 Tax=Deinandra increscens subsp. villosa TaxID=3103831 RepID=A0AAP0CLG9_9ASTR
MTFIFTNAKYGGPLDRIVDLTPMDNKTQSVKFTHYDEQGIRTLLTEYDYRIVRLLFTSNNGSVVSSRFLEYTEDGKPEEYVMPEEDHIQSLWFAEFVLWCESLLNRSPKIIETAMKISRYVKEEEDDDDMDADMTCAICLEEYEVDDMIGTLLECKHNYHEKCIKKWVNNHDLCPICRSIVFYFS